MIRVRAADLGKAHRLYRQPFDSLKELFLRRQYSETFWAVRGVTLELASGSALGIVGDNGAGKTTLLKLLAGAIVPTEGRVERVGRVAAMLSLGAGFHPDLTGAENIRIGCAMLGLSPAETAQLTPQIADFSELGAFLARPVRTYSSGMSLRLGFSVATAVDPDILIVDEHLAVGDQHFQHKCRRRIMALRSAGCALVLCSHDLFAVRELCERALWLREGRPAMLAATHPVLDAYQDHVRARDAGTSTATHSPPTQRQRPVDNYLDRIELGGDVHDGEIESGRRLELRVVARLTEAAWRDGVHVAALIVRNDGVWCHGVRSKPGRSAKGLYPLEGNEYGIRLVIDELPLLSGEYTFTVALMDDRSPHTYDHGAGICAFRVRHGEDTVGVARVSHRWEHP